MAEALSPRRPPQLLTPTPSSQIQVGASGQGGHLASSPQEPCKAPEISSLEGILWPMVVGIRLLLLSLAMG